MVTRLVGQRQRQQLIDEAAGALLALHDLAQLRGPCRGVALRQAVFGQRSDPGQRRAQLMRHIAGEFALRPHRRADACHQGIEGPGQVRDVARARRELHRRQIAGIPLLERTLELAHRLQLAADRAAQPQSQAHEQDQLRGDCGREQLLRQLRAAPRGLRDDHRVGHRKRPRQADHAKVQAAVVAVLEDPGLGLLGRQRSRQPALAREQAAIGARDREVDLLVLVEEHGLDLARRQVEDELAVALADIRRDRIGVVEQGSIEGLAGVDRGHRDRHRAADEPGQCQWQHDLPEHASAQRGQHGVNATSAQPASPGCGSIR